MASEEQEMLLKISQLAGQINRRKNGQPSDSQTVHALLPSHSHTGGSMRKSLGTKHRATDLNKDHSQGWPPSRGAYPSRGFARGSRTAPTHRNRSLVLNGSTSTAATLTESLSSALDDAQTSTGSGPGWVAKTGRHLQLINTSIYEKDTQTRAKAMEETRKQKLKQRDDREKAKLHKHIQRLGAGDVAGSTAAAYEFEVQGIRFRVTKNGSKLARVSDDLSSAKSTPKTAMVGGVRFYRTKNGNMYRSGIVKAHKKIGVVKKINEPCKAFSTTGSSVHFNASFELSRRGGHTGLQLTPRVLGSCTKGPRCRYIHDPSKVAVCKEFLLTGSCPSGDLCDLSHELTPERTPTCLHFAKGNCSKANCRYTHVRVSPSALVCLPFGIYGYCAKGANCEARHVHECPEFSNTGKCTTKGCKLPHRHKASLMRTTAEEEGSDISSDDDDDDIDTDDVDSDDLDGEYLGDDGATVDSDVPMQRDYVQFS